MDVMQWLTETEIGKLSFATLVSVIPIVELRGGIPFGHNVLGLDIWPTYLACVAGNFLPAPFIIVYIRRIFQWMRVHMPKLNRIVEKLEAKAHLKGRTVTKYKYLGLFLFVAIPLPGTGAWTGSLVAAFLDMPLRRALPAILLGVMTAGVAISILSFGLGALF